MNFSLNIKSMASSFPMPCDVADKYIKLASGVQIKVLILVMRELSDKVNTDAIADKLGISRLDAEDALLFWVRCGILSGEETVEENKNNNIVIDTQLPTRQDVIMRGMEDEKIRFLLREAQLKFARNLKNNESRFLVSLYDDYGMDISVILVLLQHAVAENKANLSYIRLTAVKWLKAGVQSVNDCEAIIAEEARSKLAFGVVARVFGIDMRKPSEKETEYSNIWVNKWNMSPEMLKAAYDACIDQKTKISFPYINKILEKWHTCGYKTVKEIKNDKKINNDKKHAQNDYAGFDIEAFEAKINSD